MRVPELDGLRAVAVLPVLGIHGSYGLIAGGSWGVDLFFVLSGYLITTLLLREMKDTGTIDLRAFYMRRALRILPPLIAATALALALFPGTQILPTLAFYANFVQPGSLGPLGHTWSLSVEEHFYLAWPLLFLAGWRGRGLVGLILCAVALRLALLWHGQQVYFATFTRIDSLAVGCLATLVPFPRFGRLALALICAAFLFVSAYSFGARAFGFTVFAVLAAVVVTDPPRFLRHPLLRYIGTRSYGIYLYHVPIFLALEPMREAHSLSNFALVTFLRVGLTFLVAELSYRTIEAGAARYRAQFAHAP